MSSHHTQKAINLHHSQIAGAEFRRQQRNDERRRNYLAFSKKMQDEYDGVLIVGFFWFSYLQFSTLTFLGYVI